VVAGGGPGADAAGETQRAGVLDVVAAIRARLAAGEKTRDVAVVYGVSKGTVHNIAAGRGKFAEDRA
jgi:hypothetical protein